MRVTKIVLISIVFALGSYTNSFAKGVGKTDSQIVKILIQQAYPIIAGIASVLTTERAMAVSEAKGRNILSPRSIAIMLREGCYASDDNSLPGKLKVLETIT